MYKQGNARGTGEVRRGTSAIHFHCHYPGLPVILLAWLPLQSLAVKNNFFLVLILGGGKLLKLVEKCR